MNHEQEVGSDGQARANDEITAKNLIRSMGLKVSRYTDNQFIQRVYLQKAIGTEDEQQQRGIKMVKEKLIRLQCHGLTQIDKISTTFRQCFTCTEQGCSWKAVVLLICKIRQSPSNERELSWTYNGWLIFSATQGKHVGTHKNEVQIISGFEQVADLYENHLLFAFNLVPVKSRKEESVYKYNQNEASSQESLQLKYGLKSIVEIKQIASMFAKPHQDSNPKETIEFVLEFLVDLRKEFFKDPVGAQQKFFSKCMKEIFFNMQIEGFHQPFDDMLMTNANRPEIVGYQFTQDSMIQDKDWIIKLDVWNKVLADKICSGIWNTFCKVATMTSDKFMVPWIHPSIDFSCNSQIKTRKRLCRLNVEKVKELSDATFRNGKKETPTEQKQQSIYQSIANLMDMDIDNGNADFNTVPDKLRDEKKVVIEQLENAKVQVQNIESQFQDIQNRLKIAKGNMNQLQEKLHRNDFVSKQWIQLAPTIIAMALKSQQSKVDQVNDFLGSNAQMHRLKDESNFQNQLERAKVNLMPKLEELSYIQTTSPISTQSSEEAAKDKVKEKKISKKKSDKRRKSKRNKDKRAKKRMDKSDRSQRGESSSNSSKTNSQESKSQIAQSQQGFINDNDQISNKSVLQTDNSQHSQDIRKMNQFKKQFLNNDLELNVSQIPHQVNLDM